LDINLLSRKKSLTEFLEVIPSFVIFTRKSSEKYE